MELVHVVFPLAVGFRASRAPYVDGRVFDEIRCGIATVALDGYGKYDTGCYITFLERMVEEYIGKEVQLNDGTICVVVLINKQKLSRPMVKTADEKYIDLATQKDLSIKALV